MNLKNLLALLMLLFVISCNTTNSLDSKLVGVWTMDKVYEFGKDVTEKHNPQDSRWIEFNEDGTFLSDGDPVGRNTGRWRLDNEKAILYLDSDVEGDDGEWNISFDGDETVWTGIGHPRKENTKLVHKRRID